MFYAKRNSEFYIFGKGPRARPKPYIRKPSPAQGLEKLGPAPWTITGHIFEIIKNLN